MGTRIARIDAIADGEAIGASAGFRNGRRELIVTRRAGKVAVFLNSCPHTGVRLDWKPGVLLDLQERHLQCSTHGALFEPDTGLCVAGPCRGQHLLRIDAELCGDAVCVDETIEIPESALDEA